MDAQTAINIGFGLAGLLMGWILNSLRDTVRSLQRQDAILADKVQAIEVLVAGTYVKRDDLQKLSDAIFSKLDRIEQKLDKKADRA